MTYTTATPTKGASLGDPDRIAAWAKARGCERPGEVADYLDTLYRLCRSIGLSAHVLVAQSIHETSEGGVPWASYWWQQRLNPAGIGITGDDDQDNASRTFADGAAAARAHALHMALYVLGTTIPTGLSKQDDPRWQVAVDAGRAGIARTIADLTGKWGTDPDYATGVTKWLNALDAAGLLANTTTTPSTTGESPVPTTPTITFGRVPAPRIVKIDTSRKPEGVGWNNLGQRKPKFVVLHRMVGSLAGTDSWFAAPSAPALTDFGIGIAAMDGTGKSGEIHQYNDSRGYRSGWASGPYSGAYGDGKAIVDKYDINVVNRDGESLEISGNYETPITDTEKQRIAEWVAWRWDLMRIPYTSAPINPETGISAVMWHQEFTLGTGKTCPGPVVMNATDDLIARAKAILKQYQTGDATGPSPEPETPPEAQYATPNIPAWMNDWKGEPVLLNVPGVKTGTPVYATTARYVARVGTPRLQYATSGSKRVGPNLNAGEDFPVAFIFSAEDGKQYGVTWYGTRVLLADLTVVVPAAT